MNVCLFTSDFSALTLPIPAAFLHLIVLPCNRIETVKVKTVEAWAESHNFPLEWQIRERSADIHRANGMDPFPGIYGDMGVSWFYTMLFPSDLLHRMPIVNFHAGPPGAHALKRSIGQPEIRCMWHWVDSGVDTGPVIIESTIALPDNFADARKAVIAEGKRLFALGVTL